MGRLPGTQLSRGRGGFLPITVWLPSPWRWPRCLGVGEVEKGAIKWRRGRSEVQPLAQALARLPEVKSGRDGFSSSGRPVGVACCFSTGPRTSSPPPARSREVLASLREGLALAPEVMAGGEVVPAPPPPPPWASDAPHPEEGKSCQVLGPRAWSPALPVGEGRGLARPRARAAVGVARESEDGGLPAARRGGRRTTRSRPPRAAAC